MSYYLGIDGGGSNLRVALVGESLNPIVEARRGSVNPNVVGFDEAKALIQSAVNEVMVAGAPLSGVGIGIAGASLAQDWMRGVITEVLPDVPVTTALDVEIALVGALGAHEGVLVLAGTGSVAFGVNGQGQTAQAGGWGYLLGDEGSGYWLGMQAIRALTQWSDGYDLGAEHLARQLGAVGGIDYRAEGWAKRLVELTGGLDVIVDGTGGPSFNAYFLALKPAGRLAVYGSTAGNPPAGLDLVRLFFRQARIIGSTMGSPDEFAAMMRFVAEHRIEPVIDRIFGLDEAVAAHQRLLAAEQLGKIVLRHG